MSVFIASFLVDLFIHHILGVDNKENDIQPVEVINIGDIGRK